MTSKTLLAAVTSAFLLGACATGGDSFGGLGSGTGIGSSVVKMAVDSQCRTELNKRNEWRVIALAMSAEKQADGKIKSAAAPAKKRQINLTATEMMQVLSPATRDQAIASVTAKTVTACFKRLYNNRSDGLF